MNETNIQSQIDALDKKLDLILEHIHQQKMNTSMVEDLFSDLSIVGKDAYDSTVVELEKRQIEIDPAQLTELAIVFLRNIENIKNMMNMMEMAIDLGKEVGPIANHAIIDLTKRMAELEQKGYFAFVKEFLPILDNIVTGFSPKDIRELANSIVPMLTTVKEMTQPDVLNTMTNAVKVFNSIQTENVPSYSLWKVMREMNTPEMQKALGFAVTFMKNVSRESTKKNK